MKITTILFLTAITFLSSCRPANPGTGEKNNEPVVQDAVPVNRCFAYDHDDDLIGLTMTLTGNRLSGKLAYAYSDRDRTSGSIEGYMKSDTLIADYTFWSDGGRTIREVVFLNRDDALVEGTGEVEQRDGKTMYKQRSALKFDESVRLRAIPCQKGGTLN